MSMRTCIIFNPAARGERARHFRERLGIIAAKAELRPTTCPGDARRLAAVAVADGFEIVVAAGGDGTVNEVLNGIGDAPDGLNRACLAVLPLGTVNVFAREIRMPKNVDAAWTVILTGKETRIDLPQAQFGVEKEPQRRYFAQMAGAGWDSLAVERVSLKLKKRIGGAAYVVAGLQALIKSLPEIIVSDGILSLTGRLVLIGNGIFYGGSYRVFPLADLRDGLLEVTILPRLGFFSLLRALYGLGFNALYTTGQARHLRGRSITLTSAAPVPFHVEGENVGFLPTEFTIQQGALRVIVPPEYAQLPPK
jgi:YegS/Rv2252/BmrU family lipid kinase